MIKNKIFEMINSDVEFKRYISNETKIRNISEILSKVVRKVNEYLDDISTNIVKGNRIIVDTCLNSFELMEKIGLSVNGFGYISGYGSNLCYPTSIVHKKKYILMNKEIFRKEIKSSCISRFDLMIKALEILPDVNEIIDTSRIINKDIKMIGFSGNNLGNKLILTTNTLYGSIEFVADIENKYPRRLEINDISDVVEYFHITDLINCIYEEQIQKLSKINKEFEAFIVTDTFKELVNDVNDRRMVMEL